MQDTRIGMVQADDAQIPFPTTRIRLGPSGFRDLAEKIPKVAYRVGIYVGSKVVSSKTPVYYVIMVTASHNPKQYNGIKPSNCEGLSLTDEESMVIEDFVNNTSSEWVSEVDVRQKGHPDSRVFIGMDARETSPYLYSLLTQSLKHFDIQVFGFSRVTTPTLYSYCYSYINQTNGIRKGDSAQQISSTYLEHSITNFKKAAQLLDWNDKPNVTLDCANGVVGFQIKDYQSLLEQHFDVNIINSSKYDQPNQFCGSDFVTSFLKLPVGIVSLAADKFVSFDGDGDRIVVYFKKSEEEQLALFDGDRLNSIFLRTLKGILDVLEPIYNFNLKMGCICTVVSNQGLRKYSESLGVPISVCPVGIKYLFSEVHNYDIGSLFESSGHGSFFVSTQVYKRLTEIKDKHKQLELLLCLLDLCNNNSRGDGLKNFLVGELCQKYLKLSNPGLFLYKQYEYVSTNVHFQSSELLKIHLKTGEVEQPAVIVDKLAQISKLYPEVAIVLRKSTTERNLVRVRLQSDVVSKQEMGGILNEIKEVLLSGDAQLKS